jgi:hypothetical protein
VPATTHAEEVARRKRGATTMRAMVAATASHQLRPQLARKSRVESESPVRLSSVPKTAACCARSRATVNVIAVRPNPRIHLGSRSPQRAVANHQDRRSARAQPSEAQGRRAAPRCRPRARRESRRMLETQLQIRFPRVLALHTRPSGRCRSRLRGQHFEREFTAHRVAVVTRDLPAHIVAAGREGTTKACDNALVVAGDQVD